MVQVGDEVWRIPVTFAEYEEEPGKHKKLKQKGVVEFVHPKGRFHRVAFQTPGGVVRECFSGVEV